MTKVPTEKLADRPTPGGTIASVEPGSVADSAGLRPGDRILAANGRPLFDVLDYQFYTSESVVELLVECDGKRRSLTLVAEAGLGIQFAEPTFDGIRRCRNNCAFCFVPQNPRGARRSLFVKDDDYRYSALYGGFVTMTNLEESDWARIREQRLSPLNVSVHATDVALRRLLLGNPSAPDVLEQIRRLIDLRVVVNAQVVVCPGLNDGAHLDQTLADLAALYPGVQHLSVVPVGLTDNGVRCVVETRRPTPDEARRVLDQIAPWRRKMRRAYGESFVHASDEFYLLAGVAIPSARQYDGFPQYSNGVGMVRSLLDEAARFRRRPGNRRARFARATAVCGTLAAPVLAPILAEVGDRLGCQIEVVAVENCYFGPSVNVSGLLTAGDVLAALRGREHGEVILAPGHMLDVLGARFLDDATPGDLESALGRPVRFASTLREVLRALA